MIGCAYLTRDVAIGINAGGRRFGLWQALGAATERVLLGLLNLTEHAPLDLSERLRVALAQGPCAPRRLAARQINAAFDQVVFVKPDGIALAPLFEQLLV